jgi:hypothetical protein
LAWQPYTQAAAAPRLLGGNVREHKTTIIPKPCSAPAPPGPSALLGKGVQRFLDLYCAVEKIFGISYPTVKNRLKRIADRLPLTESAPPRSDNSNILDQIESGEISAQEGIRRMS